MVSIVKDGYEFVVDVNKEQLYKKTAGLINDNMKTNVRRATHQVCLSLFVLFLVGTLNLAISFYYGAAVEYKVTTSIICIVAQIAYALLKYFGVKQSYTFCKHYKKYCDMSCSVIDYTKLENFTAYERNLIDLKFKEFYEYAAFIEEMAKSDTAGILDIDKALMLVKDGVKHKLIIIYENSLHTVYEIHMLVDRYELSTNLPENIEYRISILNGRYNGVDVIMTSRYKSKNVKIMGHDENK